jgi:hypothetical protein
MVLIITALVASGAAEDRASSPLLQELKGPFDLSGARSPQVQYFRMETRFVHIGFDGKRTGTETYVLKLKGVPAPGPKITAYTVRHLLMRMIGKEEYEGNQLARK